MMNLETLKFPIGHYQNLEHYNPEVIKSQISVIQNFPAEIEKLTQKLSIQELQLTYRPDGWTIKQVVHHCADSHMNSFIRFKLALTEENPTIKPYREDLWANLIDGNDDDIRYSLKIIYAVHYKWVLLLQTLEEQDLQRTFYHPENKQTTKLFNALGFYAWHCKHHLKHIEIALNLV